MIEAQEEERHRVSRELHDEAGQALTALKISLDLIRSDLSVDTGPLHQRILGAVDLTDTTMEKLGCWLEACAHPSWMPWD